MQERADNHQFINEFLERWPDSPLAGIYKYNSELAKATKAYRELECKRPEMDPIDYEIELHKIASTINIGDIQ